MGKKVTFSTEPNNLKGTNSYKYNALVNKKAVAVVAAPDNKGVVLCTKKKTAQRKPATMFNRTVIRSDLRHTNKVIRKVLGTSGYRADLIEAGVRKADAILASQKPAKRLQAKKRRH
eukprot:Em0162g4a